MPEHPVINKFLDLPKIKKPDNGREWVYCLRAETPSRVIKIGHSANLKWRLSGLQTQCPVQLSLVGLFEGPAGSELVLHEAMAASRLHGEWFSESDQVRSLIKAMPKGEAIESTDVLALVSPFGMSKASVYEIFLWAATWEKHRRKYEGKITRADAARAMSGVNANNFEATLREKISTFQLFGNRGSLC